MAVKWSAKKKKIVWNMTDGRCWYCGVKLKTPKGNPDEVKQWFTIDHCIPQTQDGNNNVDNLVPCCFSCNARKCGRTIEEYRGYLIWIAIGLTPFTTDQIVYLENNGIEVPLPITVTFYGETLEGDK